MVQGLGFRVLSRSSPNPAASKQQRSVWECLLALVQVRVQPTTWNLKRHEKLNSEPSKTPQDLNPNLGMFPPLYEQS